VIISRWKRGRNDAPDDSVRVPGLRLYVQPGKGDLQAGIPPGTEFDALPDDWLCPECGAGKDQFVEVQA
jgi:rubredoxin